MNLLILFIYIDYYLIKIILKNKRRNQYFSYSYNTCTSINYSSFIISRYLSITHTPTPMHTLALYLKSRGYRNIKYKQKKSVKLVFDC